MQLLRNPELTVTEIAQFVGYSQAGYFARRFREIAGSSPREYRDKL
jgi:AraC-like DNA-binding protein